MIAAHVATPAEARGTRFSNGLGCQTDVIEPIGQKGLFRDLSNDLALAPFGPIGATDGF
jgi:hypothetical protein